MDRRILKDKTNALSKEKDGGAAGGKAKRRFRRTGGVEVESCTVYDDFVNENACDIFREVDVEFLVEED